MGLHGVTQFIDAIDGGIGSSVKTDGVVGAADIIIDGGRDADDVDAVLTQRLSATECTVAADGNDAVQTQQLADRNRLFLTFFGGEFLAAGSIENGAAAIDGPADNP